MASLLRKGSMAPPAPESPPEEKTFLFSRKTSPLERVAVLEGLARRLGGDVKRGGRLELRDADDSLRAQADPKALTVTFGSRTARVRWLAQVQDFARDQGLIEPE